VTESLARELGRRLLEAHTLLVTAESCTGGWVAQAVTSVSGSSAWFERGFVTYSNASKQEMLGVSGATLERHGAVSEETAREMALGALARSRGTLAVAVTGVAGPAGGTAAKPVGTVCFAWTSAKLTRCETRLYTGDRRSIRRQSVERALQGVIELLQTRSK